MKTRWDLLPFGALEGVAAVLDHGATKYGAHNWKRGADWSRYYAALCRHLFAWWGGEDCDPETGASHLAHAGCCLLFLLEYERRGWGCDDRATAADGEPFCKDDGRSIGQLTIPDLDWSQVGTLPAGAATADLEPTACCFIGSDGQRHCRPASQGAIADDDDGLD